MRGIWGEGCRPMMCALGVEMSAGDVLPRSRVSAR